MTTELMTREEYVAKMSAGEWAEEGAIARKYRILFGLTIAEVASAIGTSPSTLGRYERGFPVSSARLLGAACFLYLDRRRMMLEPDTDNTYHKADFLIDYGEDSLLIKKREYRVVAEINTGDHDLDQELAKSFCEKQGGDYYFVH
ncbi:helix-turn-helix transcriptional regulator [Paenibacillus sp. FSL F4-0122]|uniref:helix-turn-helix domain-containing protein n=1 Tax=unclassified Paenibacillus TaxID=185978 RepID=UPI0030CB0114